MQRLIPVLNELHDVFSAIGRPPVDLPLIVAVGAQSSGKSSVVAALAGLDVLPRGVGLCTRRPIILQLYHITGSSAGKSRQSRTLPASEARCCCQRPLPHELADGPQLAMPALKAPTNGLSSGTNPSKSFSIFRTFRKGGF